MSHYRSCEERNMLVKVDPNILKVIRSGNYNLCISKMVNDEYAVIWQAISNISSKNYIKWTPRYTLFASNYCVVGRSPRPCTSDQPIKGGEHCILNSFGILEKAKGTSQIRAPLFVRNCFKPIHFGLSMKSEEGKNTVIYVTSEKCLPGISGFTPKEKVLVWFEEEQQSGTIIKQVSSQAIEVDMSSESHIGVLLTDTGTFNVIPYE